MNLLDFLVPWVVVGGLLYAVRRLERWLHQHIFKVGWLLTKNLRATTVLYYIFFLPGVFLHELLVWLIAGVLNVRAERAIVWPEAQAMAELKLNFIRLGKNVGRIRLAIIGIAPLLGGLAVIWLIATSILNLDEVIAMIRVESWNSVGDVFSLLLRTPDVWLWVYLTFTIANTMMPEREMLQGWRPILIGAAVLLVVLYVVGIGQQILLDNLAVPISDGLNRLVLIFLVIVVIDLLVTGALGLLESIIERVTRNSATFQNGKLVAVTREEMLKQRQQARAKAQQSQQAQRSRAKAASSPTRATAAVPAGGAPSFYSLPLPIPAAPGRESEQITVRRDDKSVLPPGAPPGTPPGTLTGTLPGASSRSQAAAPVRAPLTPTTPIPAAPEIITGSAVVKTEDDLEPETPLQEARLDVPTFAAPPAPVSNEEKSEESNETSAPAFDVLDDFADAINPAGGDAQDEDDDR